MSKTKKEKTSKREPPYRLITHTSLTMRKLWLDGRAGETTVTPPVSFRVMEADM